MGRPEKPKKGKAEAKRPPVRKSPKDDGGRGRELEKRLDEALKLKTEALKSEAEALGQLQTRDRQLVEAQEQQTATSEILRVISRSQTDVQPVFDTIVRSAVRLCHGIFSALFRYDGELLHLVAQHNFTPEALEAAHRVFPTRPTRGLGAAVAILERRVVHIPDVTIEPEYQPALAQAIGIRSSLYVPMLREGTAIGVIGAGRAEPRPFSDTEIELLRTFADQAVIAIENVRLFTETREALERQTATSEILRVISRSQTDAQPVFDTIVRNAVRLCGAVYGSVNRFDGEHVHFIAHHNYTPEHLEAWRRRFPRPLGEAGATGRVIIERRPWRVDDVAAAPEGFSAEGRADLLARGARSVLIVPMSGHNRVIGTINLSHREVGAFTDVHVELLETFADQAVIAIENVRLFTELQQKNSALTEAHAQVSEALEQQTATSEILRVISSSPTDVQPVFDTIVASATRLCSGLFSAVYRYDGELIHLVAHHNFSPTALAAARRTFPMPPSQGGATARAVLTREVVHIPDLRLDPEYAHQTLARDVGFPSLLAVPMLREGMPIGAITVAGAEAAPFSDKQISLLQTFADQAVIAIENVRLFKELQERNREVEQKSRELEAASQHKSEFLANMSHELRTPLNAIIGYSELLEEEAGDLDGGRLVPDLKKIATAAKHQLSLINDILDLAKIEAGRMELELADFHLPSAVENALILVRERASRRGIPLGHMIDSGLGMVRADERKVKQVLLNLLSNALKFTPEGGRVDVRAGVRNDVAEISVADTGVGIAPEDQEAVFEEFRQVGAAAKKVEGTGLGLALSRKFVDLHGGRISVTSQVGQGSTFTFTLPVRSEKEMGA